MTDIRQLFNVRALYREDGTCKLCEGAEDDHAPGCIGQVGDNLQLFVQFRGYDYDGTLDGYTDLEDLARNLAEKELQEVGQARCTVLVTRDADFIYVPTEDGSSESLTLLFERTLEHERAKAKQAVADRKAAELRERKARARLTALAALEALRPDLTPDAYERRRFEIDASYPEGG